MELILRRMEINTIEKRLELDDDKAGEMSPNELRREIEMLTDLHGWDTNVTTQQVVLIEVLEDEGYGSKRLGNWNN
jgi:hypothetical protein